MQNLLSALFIVFSVFSMAQTVIYSEDFQSGLPIDYTIVDNDGRTVDASVAEFAPAWIALEDPDNSGDTVVGSTSYFDPTGRADRWLITPGIALGAFGNVLYWEGKSHDASFPDGYHVYVSTTDTEIASFTDTIFTTNSELETWNEREVSLSAEGYNNVTVHIAFVNRTNNGFKLYLDDIRVETENSLQITDEKQAFITIYPNPTNGMITINGEFDRVQVLNTTGGLVLTSEHKQVDLSTLENGIYYLRIYSNGSFKTQKISKI